MHKPLFYVLFFIFFNCSFWAQQYSFINYSVEDGLAQTQVFDLESDSTGYLWIGTAGGVSRFDGANFVNYSTNKGLRDNAIQQIKIYQNKTWIASQYGITSIKGKEIITWDLYAITKGNGITSIAFDFEQNLWIAIRGRGVCRVPIKNNKLILKDIQLFPISEKNYIKSLYCDHSGAIWVGGKNILGYFLKNKWTSIRNDNMFSFLITDFVQNKANDLFFSTSKKGLFAIKNKKIDTVDFNLKYDRINDLYFDSQNRFWICTNAGVYVLDKEGAKIYHSKNGLSNQQIKAVIEDREHNIWFASDGGGIYRLASDELLSFSKKDGLSSDYVLSILEDEKANLYFSTYGGGINKFDGSSFEYFNTNNILNDNTVWTSAFDSDSVCWFGTSKGLTMLKNDFYQTFAKEDWLPSFKILSLLNTTEGLWIGTSKGVSKIKKGEKSEVYKYPKTFVAKNCRTITKGIDNKIWVGTSNGIYIRDSHGFLPFEYNHLFQNKIIYSIAKVNTNFLLIGTANGLYSYNNKELKKIELHPSFSANNINFVGIENNKYAWIGTNYGIFEIEISKLLAKAPNAIHHYTTSNGIPSIETNLNAFFCDSRGYVWMGTSKGVIRFKRKHKKHNIVLPKVKIEKIQLFLKNTNWKKYTDSIDSETLLPKYLKLGYKKNYLTFFFNGISLRKNKELQYSFKLDGLDENWTEPTNQKSITYTNLPAGNYTFLVKASVDKDQWSTPAKFSFTINKPYYLTWWFFLLVFVIIVSLIFVFWKWRTSVTKRKELTQKLYYKSKLLALEQQTLNASMNRHFIFNSLNSIQYYINANDRLSANKYLTNFAKLIRKNLDSSVAGNNLVTVTEELERLELYLSLENMRFQNKFKYQINIKNNIDTDKIKVPPMFLQPFVENSIWHGILPQKKDGEITITLSKTQEGHYLFVIEDNGLGIDHSLKNKTNTAHTSKGMSITSGRLEILKKTTNQEFVIKGPYQIEQEDGTILGTRVEITIKKQR